MEFGRRVDVGAMVVESRAVMAVRVRREKKANEELHDHMMKKGLTWERRATLRERTLRGILRILT